MRRFKKNTGKNKALYQLNKVRFEAQAWKHAAKDLEQEVINAYREKDRAERQKKATEIESNYLDSLVEYLTHQVINAQTIEQLNESKEKYREFKKRQAQRLDARWKELEETPYLDISIDIRK